MDERTQIRLELAKLCYKPGLAADAAVSAARMLEAYVLGEKALRSSGSGEPKGPQAGGGNKGR